MALKFKIQQRAEINPISDCRKSKPRPRAVNLYSSSGMPCIRIEGISFKGKGFRKLANRERC